MQKKYLKGMKINEIIDIIKGLIYNKKRGKLTVIKQVGEYYYAYLYKKNNKKNYR